MRQVRSARRARVLSALCLAVVAALAGSTVSGCSRSASTPQVLADKGIPFINQMVPKITASVTDGAVGVAVDKPVTVTAQGGVLGPVTLTDAAGEELPGEIGPDGVTWTADEPLDYNEHYTLSATALGLGGVANESLEFESHSPANLTMPYLMPNDGDVVGVGQTIQVKFDETIPDRLAAQKAITVTTTPPVEGAFYWVSDREVRWRPKDFWASGTTVDVEVKAFGADLGNGLFGQEDRNATFTIGDRLIATADDDTKTVTIRRGDEIIKTMPTSMGKDSTPTPNGVYVIGDRYQKLIMDSSTYGVPSNSPNGYRLEVDWATQMSYSGIYVHSAPWSIGAQGSANTSHGCLNVSPANAEWFYFNTRRGDVVEVVGTVGSVLSGTDGLGDWNIPWSQWKAGNATSNR